MSGFLGEGNAYDRVSFIESGVLGALDKRTCGTDAVNDRARPPRTETSRRHRHRREGVLARADDAQDHIAATANRRAACVMCDGSESVRSTSGSATPTSRDIVLGRNCTNRVVASAADAARRHAVVAE